MNWKAAWTEPRDHRWGRYHVPRLARRDAALYLAWTVMPVVALLVAHRPWGACWWTLGGLMGFVLRNLAVAWEVRQGRHTPAYRARMEEHNARAKRPATIALTLALVLGTAMTMQMEQRGWIHLPKRQLPPNVVLPPPTPCCAVPRDQAVHQAWQDVLHAAARPR